jgi:hypothetical protein
MSNWSDNLKNFLMTKMSESNLKANNLAKLTDIPSTTIYGILNNCRPEIKNIIKIAKSFNCSIDEILGREVIKSTWDSVTPKYAELSVPELSKNLLSNSYRINK